MAAEMGQGTGRNAPGLGGALGGPSRGDRDGGRASEERQKNRGRQQIAAKPKKKSLEQLAAELFMQSAGLRQGLADQSLNFLQGGYDLNALPQFQQFQRAADAAYAGSGNTLNSLVGRPDLTTDPLLQARAAQLPGVRGTMTQDAINTGQNIAANFSQQGANAAYGGAGIQAQLAQSMGALDAGAKQTLGTGLGSYWGQRLGEKF